MIRNPVVAGRFYASSERELLAELEGCYAHKLGAAARVFEPRGRFIGAIVPHAGFCYSGPVASHAYARLKQESVKPDAIIILCPKHTFHGECFSVSDATEWRTPLGSVKTDDDLARHIVKGSKLLKLDSLAHAKEHSIEVQLPFLQFAYPEGVPPIVPIALQFASFAQIEVIALELYEKLKTQQKRVVFLVSSDFSHDTPKGEAYALDAQVMERILELDARGFYDLVVGENRSVCGLMSIAVALVLLKLYCQPVATLLKYATSMDVSDHPRGVGYAAIVFEENS